MKHLINLSVILLVFGISASLTFAQTTNQSSKGNRFGQNGNSQNNFQGSNWVDVDGDGICDNFGTNNSRNGKGNGMKNMRSGKGRFGDGSGLRPQDGTGFGRGNGNGSGMRPHDGTGFGKGNGSGLGTGTGDCDGTGPKGNGRKGGRN